MSLRNNNTGNFLYQHIDSNVAELVINLESIVKKIDGTLKKIEKIESQVSALSKEVDDIKVVKNELSKFGSENENSQIIVNSIEFQTLIDTLTPIIDKSVVLAIKDVFGEKISDVSKKLEKEIKELYEVQNKKIDILDTVIEETKDLNKDIIKRSDLIVETKDSISLLTDFMQGLSWEMKKIFPKMNVKYNVLIQEKSDLPKKEKNKNESKDESKEKQQSVVKNECDNNSNKKVKNKNDKKSFLSKIKSIFS